APSRRTRRMRNTKNAQRVESLCFWRHARADMRVVSAVPLDAADAARLSGAEVVHVDLAHDPAATAAVVALSTADGLLVNSHVAVDKALLDRAPQLRVVSTISAGFDYIDLVATRARGVT